MKITRSHVLVAIVMVAACLANALGCGNASSSTNGAEDGGPDATTGVTGATTATTTGTTTATTTGTTTSTTTATTTGTTTATTTGTTTATTTGTTTATTTGTTSGTEGGATTGAEGGATTGTDAATTDAAGAVVIPSGCTLPSTVSFTMDVQPFLAKSCGESGNGGCHVLDATSTMAEGGKDHAYDWITGTAHASSCPETPTPFRFQVVMAVMQEADPTSCSKCDKMPITSTADPRTPLTACQLATLQSWLDEPYQTQLHRNDGISPTTPYAMPPWN